MNKLERQKRNENIARNAFAGLKTEMGLVKVLYNMEGAYGLSRSQIAKIVREAIKNCQHEYIHPYKLQPKHEVCKICWSERK